jgi:hypothetical protein
MVKMGLSLALLLLASGCQGAEECKDFGASNDGEAAWQQCGDKRVRKVHCEGVIRGAVTVPGKAVACTCAIDGAVGKTFQTADPIKLMTLESATQIANEQCGWHVTR